MKTFETFEEALSNQRGQEAYSWSGLTSLETGVDNIDRIQFPLGNVLWIVLADGFYLDDYEEYVTQYGLTASGEWAAVSGGHCSCYGWEEMEDNDITYYPTLEVLLKADAGAKVIIDHKDDLMRAMPFLDI